jgi:hypothetical protein
MRKNDKWRQVAVYIRRDEYGRVVEAAGELGVSGWLNKLAAEAMSGVVSRPQVVAPELARVPVGPPSQSDLSSMKRLNNEQHEHGGKKHAHWNSGEHAH